VEKSIKDDLGKVDRRFQDGQMEDAHEFLCVFLLELSRGLDRLCLTPNLVNTNLKYWFEDTFTCCDCQAREANSHDNISFILDFPNDYSNTSRPASLQSMLTANFAADTREKYCDDCGGAQASVSTKLISLPRALNICVRRYNVPVGGGPVIKDKRPVEIPEIISLDHLLDREGAISPHHADKPELIFSRCGVANENLSYSRGNSYQEEINSSVDGLLGDVPRRWNYILSSVVSHVGDNPSSGHYVSDVLKFDYGTKWFRFSDSVVTPTDNWAVRNGANRTDGYLFMYLYESVHQQLRGS
jgi:uncharacterized UBP type Zn finger protein